MLKGGLLISSMAGISQRTTMDMGATVVGMDMDEATVSKAVAAICAVAADDGMEYLLERIEPIREGDEYANWRAHLRVRCGKMDAPIKIDITTGDEIVPGRIECRYPLMFERGEVRVLSCPLETVLAEKLETVVSRGIANTRGRDFYDIHTLLALKSGEIDNRLLHEAVVATASNADPSKRWPATRRCSKRSRAPQSCGESGPRTSLGRHTRLESTSKRSSIPY